MPGRPRQPSCSGWTAPIPIQAAVATLGPTRPARREESGASAAIDDGEDRRHRLKTKADDRRVRCIGRRAADRGALLTPDPGAVDFRGGQRNLRAGARARRGYNAVLHNRAGSRIIRPGRLPSRHSAASARARDRGVIVCCSSLLDALGGDPVGVVVRGRASGGRNADLAESPLPRTPEPSDVISSFIHITHVGPARKLVPDGPEFGVDRHSRVYPAEAP